MEVVVPDHCLYVKLWPDEVIIVLDNELTPLVENPFTAIRTMIDIIRQKMFYIIYRISKFHRLSMIYEEGKTVIF